MKDGDAATVAGVDLARLQAWMDATGLGEGPLDEIERIAGGTQNILLRFTRSGRTFVLRHPPPHKRANSDETMRREARVLAALAGSDVPHPRLIAACADVDILGSAFYLMEHVDGFNATLGLPEPHRSDVHLQRNTGLSMADAIAALGRVDYAAVGLADLGRPDGWLERQVQRWQSQLTSYALDGYSGPGLPGVDAVAAWLESARPSAWRPGLIHGDFHFANVLVHPSEGRLAAVVDWELTTLGDPLLDLGHLLCTWPLPENGGAAVGEAMPGLPTTDELITRYADGSDRAVEHVVWYRVLACYRLGIILEGTRVRADAGLAPREVGDQLHATAVALFEQAQQLID